MRIATYNVWNSPSAWDRRLHALLAELARLGADVVALQEAPMQATTERSFLDVLRRRMQYPHMVHRQLPVSEDNGRPEGLAILSKFAFKATRANWDGDQPTGNNWALRAVVDWNGTSLGISNIHLDWEHAESRARFIVPIIVTVQPVPAGWS